MKQTHAYIQQNINVITVVELTVKMPVCIYDPSAIWPWLHLNGADKYFSLSLLS